MVLKRDYPWLNLASVVCFLLSAVAFVGLLWVGDPHGAVVLAALSAGLAAIGSALWVVRTILEVGFHLHEQIQETSQRARATSISKPNQTP